jgi:hypothetical protein
VITACAVLMANPCPIELIEEILAVHFRMHKAEGLFRDALVQAAARGLRLVAIPGGCSRSTLPGPGRPDGQESRDAREASRPHPGETRRTRRWLAIALQEAPGATMRLRG